MSKAVVPKGILSNKVPETWELALEQRDTLGATAQRKEPEGDEC